MSIEKNPENYVPKAIIRWYLLGLIVLFMAGLTFVAVRGQMADAQISRISTTQIKAVAHISANTERLQRVLTTACNDRNFTAKSTNSVLNTLITAVKATKSLPPDEKSSRLALYHSIMIPIVSCDYTTAPSQYKLASEAQAMSVSMVTP